MLYVQQLNCSVMFIWDLGGGTGGGAYFAFRLVVPGVVVPGVLVTVLIVLACLGCWVWSDYRKLPSGSSYKKSSKIRAKLSYVSRHEIFL